MIHSGDLIASRYQAVRILGTGGFSRVWEAVDTSLNNRRVAVKELAAPAGDDVEGHRVLALFRREIDALSRLSHPGLPTIYDGFEENDRCYLVLELVPGEVLSDWRERHVPAVDQVVAWGCEVADILHYLHTRPEPLVVRDLKPSNLILAPDGTLRLVDLGIAAILRPQASVGTTLAGFGTPGYASPEQYGQHEVDPRADLYALGATLFFLLAGQAPPDAIDRMLGRSALPPLRAARPETPPEVVRCIQESLLALEPSCRPATALATREWLQRSGRQPTGETASAARLHPVQTLQHHQGRVLSLAFAGEGRLVSAGPDDPAALWDLTSCRVIGTIESGRQTCAACSSMHLALAGPETSISLWDLATLAPGPELREVPAGATCLAFSPDGRILAAGFWDKTVTLWDVGTGLPRLCLRGHSGSVSAVTFSPDGAMLASAAADTTVRLWSVAGGTCVHEIPVHFGPVHSVCFVGDSGQVASASWDRMVCVWSATQNVLLHRLRGHTDGVTSVAATPDGRYLASASWDATVRLWDAGSGSPVHVARGHEAPVNCLAFSSDGRTLASGARDGAIQIWKFD